MELCSARMDRHFPSIIIKTTTIPTGVGLEYLLNKIVISTTTINNKTYNKIILYLVL